MKSETMLGVIQGQTANGLYSFEAIGNSVAMEVEVFCRAVDVAVSGEEGTEGLDQLSAVFLIVGYQLPYTVFVETAEILASLKGQKQAVDK